MCAFFNTLSIQGERIVWWAQWWWEWAWGVTGKEVKIIDYCVPATEERTWGSWENGSAGNNQDHHAMEEQVKWVGSFVQRMEFPSSRFQRLKQSKLIKGPEYWHESALLKLSEDKCPWSMTEGILRHWMGPCGHWIFPDLCQKAHWAMKNSMEFGELSRPFYLCPKFSMWFTLQSLLVQLLILC